MVMIRRFYDEPTFGLWKSPLFDFERNFRNEMDRWFSNAWDRSVSHSFSGVFPLLNVTEDKENYFVRAELPGIKTSELSLEATQNALHISGERKMEEENKDVTYHRRERNSGSFRRALTFPTPIDRSRVDAKYSNGILMIKIAKAEEAQPKQIQVKTS